MPKREKDWTNILFLSLTPVIGVFGTALYAWRYGVAWWEPLLLLGTYVLVGLSVTAGYHRYFSHRSFECHPVVQAFFLFFGTLALQNSLLHWAADHRDHHRYVDSDRDPYNINRGGWWAHMLWIFYKNPKDRRFENARDLKKNRLVMWQHRWSTWIGILGGLGLPTLIGAVLGRPLGGLLWGGFLRIVVIHHTTFLINSVAHLYGTRPYSDDNSARDNWLLAFATNGEGYHNFHHAFPSDYRNGVRWFHWDPTKWFIRGLQYAGLVQYPRRTSRALIERARLRMTQLNAAPRMQNAPAELRDAVSACLENAHRLLERAALLWNEAQSKYREIPSRGRHNAEALAAAAREKIREYEACLLRARYEWKRAIAMLAAVPAAA